MGNNFVKKLKQFFNSVYKERLPVFISSISLILSVATFYFTLLSPPKIEVYSGPQIEIYHTDYPELNTGIYVPLTFTNSSARIGTISKIAISFQKEGRPDSIYFVNWKRFAQLGNNVYAWELKEYAQSFSVSGNSSVSKVVWFFWDSSPDFRLKEANYDLWLYYWLDSDESPARTHYTMKVSNYAEQYLSQKINEKSNYGFKFNLNGQPANHLILKRKQLNDLLE